VIANISGNLSGTNAETSPWPQIMPGLALQA
jgi:hypothetical protein